MMTVSIADFTDFKNEVVRSILDYLPEEYSDARVEIKEVLKNNDQKLSGLTIKKQDVNMAPTI